MGQMIEVKVSELTGAALDWAVANAVGLPLCEEACQGEHILIGRGDGDLERYSPSTDWAQGGPLIEKFIKDGAHVKISDGYRGGFTFHDDDGIWGGSMEAFSEYGETLLIAACRAIVAAHSGNTVSVPAELLAK